MKQISLSTILSLCIAAGSVPLAQAQPLVPACNMNCGSIDVACQTQQADCQAKFLLYDAYLTQMGFGVPMYSLPALYRDVLAQYFPNANLSEVEFGYSDRQPANNATCDCDNIYFNNASYVSDLQEGTIENSFYWILHELRHFEQCREQGSRDAFAKLWWDHLSQTDLTSLIEDGNWDQVHDEMQMEGDATARGQSVQTQLESCCIHPSTGRLIRPLEVAPMVFSTTNPQFNEGLTVSVEASHGAEPYAYEWSWKRPSNVTFQPVSSSPSTPNEVVLALTNIGMHELKVRVLQDDGSTILPPHEEVQTFNVVGPEVSALQISPTNVDGGSSATATVSLANLTPNQGVEVQLTSSDASAVVPVSLTATANSGGTANQTFTITTEPVQIGRTATIEARLGTSVKSAPLGVSPPTIQRVGVGMKVDPEDLYAEELFRLFLQLERPAPKPIIVSLNSSDARAVRVPRQVRFEKGEREKTISLKTARVTRETSVTLRARVGEERRSEVQTALRVKPAPPRRSPR